MPMSTDTDKRPNEPGQDAQDAIAEPSLFTVASEAFNSMAHAFSAETDVERRKLFEVVHRNLVIFDDYLCETFGFSRKPRGRYNNKKKRREDNGA